MRYTLLIMGSGGQGVLSAGGSLAASASQAGYATFVPWYGAAQRGGVAKCTIVLSDKPIVSPLPGKCMGMIAMNEDACQKGLEELQSKGLVIRNTDRCKPRFKGGDVMLMDVPADTMAKELGDIRMANNILIGALLGYTKMLPAEALKAGIRAKMAGKPEAVIEQNVKALMAGVEFGADMTHTQQIEPKVQKDCRYGIDKTTVGEILDTPELRAIVEKLFPQVLNHPLLEAGRTFKFVDAIPYMKDMISDDDLDNFQDALEELG